MTGRVYDAKKVKYFNQHDNRYEPQGTCNFTSVASCLTGYGFVGGGGRFPDEIFQKYNPDYSRHDPLTLVKIFKDYGIQDVFSYATDWEDVINHLKTKQPCILHGDWTDFGHIILLKEINSEGLIVCNDSNGEFNAKTGQYNKWASGENDTYLPSSLLKWCNYTMPGSKAVWCHRIGKGLI
jgi:hypothetical protein